jgi:transcriptional regulator with XRE-family HTH domain
MSSTPFGEQLKRERELRGVSLEEVAAATRIPPKFLEAIENEKWSELPGGVFNRGFIRSVARFLGLDEDNMVAEYELMTRDQPETRKPAEGPMHLERNWTALVIVILTALALLAGAVFLAFHLLVRLHARPHDARAAAAVHAPAVTGTASNPAPAASPGKTAETSGAGQPASNMELRIDAGKSAQVTVVADGKIVFGGRMRTGESKRFSARDTFDVTSSDASALLLELNGRIVPPMGSPGEMGNVRLTHQDLNPSSEAPH